MKRYVLAREIQALGDLHGGRFAGAGAGGWHGGVGDGLGGVIRIGA
jgi:hypothetical protein